MYARKLTRGGREKLGIPTANIPPDGLAAYPDLASGVYFGVVVLEATASEEEEEEENDGVIRPAVLSIGFNPFYGNTLRSVVCPLLPSPPLFFLWMDGRMMDGWWMDG